MEHESLVQLADSTGQLMPRTVILEHLSDDYYRYLKTSAYSDRTIEGGSSLTEPRTPTGNVKNGYGLFTVFAVVTDTIR